MAAAGDARGAAGPGAATMADGSDPFLATLGGEGGGAQAAGAPTLRRVRRDQLAAAALGGAPGAGAGTAGLALDAAARPAQLVRCQRGGRGIRMGAQPAAPQQQRHAPTPAAPASAPPRSPCQALTRDTRQAAGPLLLEAWLDAALAGPGPPLAAHPACAAAPLHAADAARWGLSAFGLSRQQLLQVQACGGRGGPWG
jgi:hypothetical protein